MRIGAEDLFAVEFKDESEHTVGGGVLGSATEGGDRSQLGVPSHASAVSEGPSNRGESPSDIESFLPALCTTPIGTNDPPEVDCRLRTHQLPFQAQLSRVREYAPVKCLIVPLLPPSRSARISAAVWLWSSSTVAWPTRGGWRARSGVASVARARTPRKGAWFTARVMEDRSILASLLWLLLQANAS